MDKKHFIEGLLGPRATPAPLDTKPEDFFKVDPPTPGDAYVTFGAFLGLPREFSVESLTKAKRDLKRHMEEKHQLSALVVPEGYQIPVTYYEVPGRGIAISWKIPGAFLRDAEGGIFDIQTPF